ncbi:hypothetical protein GCM10010518_30890 [Kitasatospora cinereorecta]
MTGGGERPDWAVRLARRAVQDVAPDEMPQFAVVSRAYLTASENRRQRAMRKAEPLGLGLEGVAVLVTTAVLAVATQVSDHLAQQLVDRTVGVAEPALRTRWYRWRARLRGGGGANGEPLPALTPEQLAQVRQLAVQSGMRQRLTPPVAQAVADGIIAELATAAAQCAATDDALGAPPDRDDRTAEHGDSAAG